MVPKPLKGLPHSPEFAKLGKHQPNGLANSLVGMQHYLAGSILGVSHRKPFQQLTTTCFRFLPSLQPLSEDLQFDNTQCSFDTQNKLIIQVAQVVHLLLIAD